VADDMLIVAGTFTVDPDRRAEFLEGRLEAIRTSREEQGCLQYAMSADAVEPGLVRLFEIWSTRADLRAHLERARSSAPAEGGVPVLAADLKMYVDAEEQPFGV
jgi:quinol monooxygenase YgiN